MLAYYPNRIRTFPVHRDLMDDVEAKHVNDIQAELNAIMTVVGTSPHVYNDLETDANGLVAPDDAGGVIDDDTQFTTSQRFYNPKVKPFDHGTVTNRLDNIERGRQFQVFRLGASNLDIASKATSLSERPRGIRFPKPGDKNDPRNLYDGVGVTLRKSGFWLFSGCVVYNLQGPTNGSNDGTYQAAVDIDGSYLDGMARDEIAGRNKHPSLNPFVMTWVPRGTRITLRTSHNSGRNQKIRLARLSGVLIREQVED